MADIFELFRKISSSEKTGGGVSYIVAGLGNPGEEYTFTRHNAGFLCIDYLCQKYGIKCNKLKFNALTCEAEISGVRVLVMKPQTFMNSSGEAIGAAASFYKIMPENVIIISDDVSLDVGRMRIKRNGSAGGHNGLKSIISHLDSEDFPRIKIGVGKLPSPDADMVKWVLGRIPKELEKNLFGVIECVPSALELMLNGKIEDAMCNFNGISK